MGKLQLPPPNFLHFFLLIYWIWLGCLLISPSLMWGVLGDTTEAKTPLRSSIISRNLTRANKALRGNARLFQRNVSSGLTTTESTLQKNVSKDVNVAVTKVPAPSESVTVQHSTKVAGVDKGGTKNPEELIRNVLLNHTLEHGGEEDLDKLVFSTLPQGKKLVLRTVRIIRTDENGDPIDADEDAQPTYWDVTLANATAEGDNEEVTEEDEESEEELEGDEETSPSESKTVGVNAGKKKSDLETSGSHSAENYHHLNNYGHAGREKEHGKTHYHGNTHGNHHKQTYTVTDGKDVKPFHGTEKGTNDYANDHGGHHKDHGERFKTSKRKNKGRKVSGFKRVYHKEEFQRTEHFFDDEEANKIAESFGLSESKGANNHGTKDDKRKYQGVHTDYLDGKKHENEHGKHDGYHKGQHTQYQETERHKHHNDYGGKSMSQHHNSNPHYHNNHHGHGGEYHPNHNYHGSHSTPKKNTITVANHQQHPLQSSVVADQLGKVAKLRANSINPRVVPAVFSAPMATSFSVTEFSPVEHSYPTGEEETTPTGVVSEREKSVRAFPFTKFPAENATETESGHTPTENNTRRRRPRKRKRPQENRIFFSPKHRPVQENVQVYVATLPNEESTRNQDHNHLKNFASFPKDPAPYPTSSSIRETNEENGQDHQLYSPYAPNFGPTKKPVSHQGSIKNNEMLRPAHLPRQTFRRFKPWVWPRHRHHRLRPESHSHSHGHNHNHNHEQQLSRPTPVVHIQSSPTTSIYPVVNHINPMSHLASIPLRHANAYNKLANRAKYQNYFYQQPGNVGYYELSTRKSDILEDDGIPNGNSTHKHRNLYDPENDKAHYFNHNQRYAKNHLTSTIQPPPSSASPVRNTLLDPVPGHYSTLIKVLPATMLKVNESTAQSNLNNFGGVQNALAAPPTRRPGSPAESVSFTTEYPIMHHHPQMMMPQHSPSQHQSHRPFIPNPKNKWLTFSLNLGNPDFKLGHEFGAQQHPFASNSKRVSKFMQGIRNGILRPFGRMPMMGGQPTPLAAPNMMTQDHPHPLQQNSFNMQNVPMQVPMYAPAPSTLLYSPPYPQTTMFQRPRPPLIRNPFNLAMPGMLALGTKEKPQTVPAPLASRVSGIGRPKFFYKEDDTINGGKNKTVKVVSHSIENATKSKIKNDTEFSKRTSHKPTLKVSVPAGSSPSVTIRIRGEDNTTLSPNKKKKIRNSTIASENQNRLGSPASSVSSQPPPFINGIMDTVAGFYGEIA